MAIKYNGENVMTYLLTLLKGKFDTKVDKETGKGLSEANFTADEKTKLANIAAEANKYELPKATDTELGGVKVGSGLKSDVDGKISVDTVDNLTSTDSSKALSAAQGKALKSAIDKMTGDIGALGGGDMMKATYDTDDDGVVDDAAKLGGQAPAYYAVAETVNTALSGKVDVIAGKQLSTEDYTTAEKTKLGNIAAGAEVNQNAYTKVKVGAVTLTAGDKSDTLNVEAGANMSVTADATGKKVVIAGDYKTATVDTAGLMSGADKAKLDGLSNYDLSAATATKLGGVKIGGNVDVATDGTISVKDASTAQKGVVQLSSATDSDSEVVAATAKAVQSAYALANSKQSPATTLAGYGIGNAYTKDEVDGLVASSFHYKGTKAKYSDLPAASNKVGDVWNITTADKVHNIKAGDNVAWTGTEWDVLAGVVDLSAYTPTDEFVEYTNPEVQAIWDKVFTA